MNKLIILFSLLGLLSVAHAEGKQPYQEAGGKPVNINGKEISRNDLYRLLPVIVPLPNIRITSLYGMRPNPFGGNGIEFHPGVDMGAPVGTPVFNTGAGKVTYTGNRGDYGTMVEVTHILGFVTRYAHLSSINVQDGQILDRGTQIGTVGSTGRSTGPHLFFEIRLHDKSIDPIVFILKAYQVYNGLASPP